MVELLCLALTPPLLHTSAYFVGKTFGILGPNDNNSVVYAVVAVMYATPGVLLVAVALGLRTRGRLSVLGPPQRRWSPGRRLASLTATEWAWSAVAVTAATVLWRLYLDSLT
ncbi:MAG TPA: hypothetical protein VF661_05175 [Actinomycetales bacterium]